MSLTVVTTSNNEHLAAGIEDIHKLIDGKESEAVGMAAVILYKSGAVGYHYSHSERTSKLALIGAVDILQRNLVDSHIAVDTDD